MSFTSPGRGFRINGGPSPVLTAPKGHKKIPKRLEVEAASGDVADASEFRTENWWKIKPCPAAASTSSLFGIYHSGCPFLLLFFTIGFIQFQTKFLEIRLYTPSSESVKFTLSFGWYTVLNKWGCIHFLVGVNQLPFDLETTSIMP